MTDYLSCRTHLPGDTHARNIASTNERKDRDREEEGGEERRRGRPSPCLHVCLPVCLYGCQPASLLPLPHLTSLHPSTLFLLHSIFTPLHSSGVTQRSTTRHCYRAGGGGRRQKALLPSINPQFTPLQYTSIHFNTLQYTPIPSNPIHSHSQSISLIPLLSLQILPRHHSYPPSI